MRFRLVLTVGAAVLFLAACPAQETPVEPPVVSVPDPPQPVAPPPAEPPPSAGPDAVVDDGETVRIALTGNDALLFNLNEIRLAAGRKVVLTLTHTGQGSVEALGHNFVLLAADTDVMQFGLAAVNAEASEFIPAEFEDRVVVHTGLVGGGDSVTIDFAAPPPGTYPFLCSFRGHFATMQGVLIVE